MTREELNGWNICKERPDAIVFKDVIFDHFEALLKAKDEEIAELYQKSRNKGKTILSFMDLQDNWIAERADLQAKLQDDCDECKYETPMSFCWSYNECKSCKRRAIDHYTPKTKE